MKAVELKNYLKDVNEKYENSDDFLGIDSMTISNKINSSRLIMFNTHISQNTSVKNPEFPIVFTGYENVLGRESNYLIKAQEDCVITNIIYKNKFNYYIITKDKNNHYDIFLREEATHLTEKFCVPQNNSVIDSKKVNDTFCKNDTILRSTSFDDNDNYCYGLNAKTVYICDSRTTEDSFVISESFAERLTSYSMYDVEVMVNKNDLLVNIYGNSKDYKAFPEIGQKVKNGILLARRRIVHNELLFSLDDRSLNKINLNDQKFYCNGMVVDITIFNNNKDLLKMKSSQVHSQICNLYEQQRSYQQELFSVIQGIIKNKKCTYSEEIRYMYARLKEELDDNKKYTLEKQEFEGTLIKFKVLKENKIKVGDKLTGRHGNKATVSKIEKDENMPISEDGIIVDIIQNSYSVPNRLNISQNFEVELGFIGSEIARRIYNTNDMQQKLDMYLEIIKDTSSSYYNKLLDMINDDNVEGIINDIEKSIYIHQKPFWDNVNIDTLERIYDKYQIHPKSFTVKGKPLQNKLIVGSMYIMRLKHEAFGKYSVRSTSFLGMKGTPSKSTKFKEFKALFSNTPIRIGEMEVTGLLNANKPELVRMIIDAYSGSESARLGLIHKKVYGQKLDRAKKSNTNKDNLKMLFNCLGFDLLP